MNLTFITVTPGRRHAWYDSEFGLLCKPFSIVKGVYPTLMSGSADTGRTLMGFPVYAPAPWWRRLWAWIKSLWQR